ncbi:hypothetical protein COLU111180_11930 [Cohnella lubricantis]|uniref:Uncharacterized protein n=1 Tax=Cohnella lubricantis TaxID=2163172 RepID=A0A841T9Q7_9BACL|nr:hypothetical protein [Cohnella lubricantis]MBB6675990.1 hypothetical protein [Cohnella lubricantis]MBP2117891.1 hypothetical protein [Cohnella lubricantis]
MDDEKSKRIAAAKSKIKRQFSKLDARTKKIAESLIDNAAFMVVTLEDLQAKINTDGAVSKYQNGANQWGTKKSPEVEIYNSMIKNHMSIMKQLTDLLPKPDDDGGGQKDDGFDEFVNNR